MARLCSYSYVVSEIIKTKFLCKTTMSEVSRHGSGQWRKVFIAGQTYSGEYQTWSWPKGYEVNGGWKRYWIIDHYGEKQELTRARFRAIFHYDDVVELRNNKLEKILNKEI